VKNQPISKAILVKFGELFLKSPLNGFFDGIIIGKEKEVALEIRGMLFKEITKYLLHISVKTIH